MGFGRDYMGKKEGRVRQVGVNVGLKRRETKKESEKKNGSGGGKIVLSRSVTKTQQPSIANNKNHGEVHCSLL